MVGVRFPHPLLIKAQKLERSSFLGFFMYVRKNIFYKHSCHDKQLFGVLVYIFYSDFGGKICKII